jgi:hypothetical protein
MGKVFMVVLVLVLVGLRNFCGGGGDRPLPNYVMSSIVDVVHLMNICAIYVFNYYIINGEVRMDDKL